MRFATMLEVAQDLGLKLPSSTEEQKKLFLLTNPLQNLGMVLGKFRMAQTLLHSYAVLERLAYETVRECSAENTRIVELRYAPTFISDGHPELSWDGIHEAFLRGVRRAQNENPIVVGLILIIQRTLSPQVAEAVVDFAITHKNTIVGLDLADNEDGFEARPFEAAFQRAKAAGLHITVHAGEVPTPQALINMEESILRLGAERIGHGIQAIKSPLVLELLRKHQVTLEVCPTSNYLTQVVPKLAQHPLRSLQQEGILLTISTDDPGIFDYTLAQEIQAVEEVLGFSKDEIRQFQRNAFRASFVSDSDKQTMASYFGAP
jgi:adenosine deaminase